MMDEYKLVALADTCDYCKLLSHEFYCRCKMLEDCSVSIISECLYIKEFRIYNDLYSAVSDLSVIVIISLFKVYKDDSSVSAGCDQGPEASLVFCQ